MSRTMVNFVVDAFLLSITVSLLFITAVLRFVFPPPTAAAGWTLWGTGYDAWANAQFVLVSMIGLAILLHIMLHWSWVMGVVVTRLLGRPARGQGGLDPDPVGRGAIDSAREPDRRAGGRRLPDDRKP